MKQAFHITGSEYVNLAHQEQHNTTDQAPTMTRF